MLREVVVLKDRLGLHARPAVALARSLRELDAGVEISFAGEHADGRDIMGLMSLRAVGGDAVTVTASGPQEAAAMAAVREQLQKSCLTM